MMINIKALTSKLSEDYFDFFDNRAFTDDSPYRCYCQVYQVSKGEAHMYENVDEADLGRVARKIAAQQIESGTLNGYLAFVDGLAIGWCNANDKANYPIEPYIGESFYAAATKREKAVICFEIAPDYRGKGVATQLLRRVIDEAKDQGYTAVEAFPKIRDQRYEWDFTGPLRLYEKFGFVKVAEREKGTVVMRLEL